MGALIRPMAMTITSSRETQQRRMQFDPGCLPKRLKRYEVPAMWMPRCRICLRRTASGQTSRLGLHAPVDRPNVLLPAGSNRMTSYVSGSLPLDLSEPLSIGKSPTL